MKRLLPLLSLLVALAPAHADLVVEQKVESALQNGDVTLKLKGDKMRTDMETGPMGSMSSIADLRTGDTITLIHGQKMAMKVSGAQTKQMIEMMKKQQAQGGAAPAANEKPQATGKKEKVGEFDTEIYTAKTPTGSFTFWVATDFPNFAKIKPQLDNLNKAAASMAQGMGPDYSSLPGVAVKTTAEMAGQKFTTTLVSVKEEPLDASLFDVPAGYQQMAQPGLPGAPGLDAPTKAPAR